LEMALTPGAEIPVNPNVQKFGIGLSWDRGITDVDVDLQAVVVDDKGTIIDAVYYNNLKAVQAVTHSGDEDTGARSGLDEVVWVNMQRLPDKVKLILFVVAAYARGHLKDVQNGLLHLLEDTKDNSVGHVPLERSEEEVDAVAVMLRDGSGEWSLRIINVPAADGRHFVDILEPTLGNLIRAAIPGAPKRQKVAFAMEKGAVVDLPETSAMRRISAGLGWDVAKGSNVDVDLDVSVVLFSGDGTDVGAVFFGNTEEFGVKHGGDNLTGEGSGDDEVIQVDLEKIPGNVEQLVFCVNIYTKGVCFDRVSNAYCRICDEQGQEMARYVLREAGANRGLLIARLFREQCRERRPWADYFGLRSGVPGNRGTLNILEGIDGVGSLILDFVFVNGQTGRALSVVCPNCPSGQVGAEAM